MLIQYLLKSVFVHGFRLDKVDAGGGRQLDKLIVRVARDANDLGASSKATTAIHFPYLLGRL